MCNLPFFCIEALYLFFCGVAILSPRGRKWTFRVHDAWQKGATKKQSVLDTFRHPAVN